MNPPSPLPVSLGFRPDQYRDALKTAHAFGHPTVQALLFDLLRTALEANRRPLHAKIAVLHRLGMNDAEIATRVSETRACVARIRRETLHLPANRQYPARKPRKDT